MEMRPFTPTPTRIIMKSSIKTILKIICLSLILFPLATYAVPTGEIIFRHPVERNELWIGNVNDGQSARPIFKLPHIISSFSIQKNGRYIVAVVKITNNNEFNSFYDVYLLDRENLNAETKKLTRGQHSEIIDADVSPDRDVVFTNHSFVIIEEKLKRGLYLVPNDEVEKKNPTATLIQQVNAYRVDWAPDGNKIAYSTNTGIFLFNILTKQVSFILKDGDFPVFSPNSKQLAFITRTKPYKLGILSVEGPRNLHHIEELEKGIAIDHLTWSVDGQYLVYTVFNTDPAHTNFAVHIENGHTERILETYSNGGLNIFEWATKAYALEPSGLLTTLWGEIKQK